MIFFLHGRFGVSECWDGIAEALAAHFRCICIDLPGFGRSVNQNDRGLSVLEHAELVARIAERFTGSSERAVLVGHDIGGAIAELCAIQAPERLAGLVLINTACVAQPVEGLETGPRGLLCRRKLGQLLHASTSLAHTDRALLTSAWQSARSRAGMISAFRSLAHSWPRYYERQAWRAHLRKVRHPVLLLWGALDRMNREEAAQDLLLELPEAYLHVHSQCGHWPLLECPDWVLEKMREFFFRIGAETYGRGRAAG